MLDSLAYADTTRMKRLGQEDPAQGPDMRRMMLAQALAGGGSSVPNMSPMGAAMGGLARGIGQGMTAGRSASNADAQKADGIWGYMSRLFGQNKGPAPAAPPFNYGYM